MESCFRIEDLRQKYGITQTELAARLGFRSPSLISMWESGSRKPPSSILPKLALELGCSIEELYSAHTNPAQGLNSGGRREVT